jgi:hypothetical protein
MADLTFSDRESLLADIRQIVPRPIQEETQPDGSHVLVGGDPGEVIIRMIGGRISVAEFTVRWEGVHNPAVRPRQIATLNWKRIPASRMGMLLQMLVETACEMRRAKFRTCGQCGETTPPEWMHDESICMSCASSHFGVVY